MTDLKTSSELPKTARRGNVLINCASCGDEFRTWTSRVAHGTKFCSTECFSAAPRARGPDTRALRSCETCAKEFRVWPSQAKRFCSKTCAASGKTRSPDDTRALLKSMDQGDANGCWIWDRCVNRLGYGKLGFDGALHAAHRVSYMVHHGPIPRGLFVCHRCDVRACVNPDHLFLGTGAENTHDMIAKGRNTKGEASPVAKLTEAAVREIRRNQRPVAELAKQFGVSYSAVRFVRLGHTWAHVT